MSKTLKRKLFRHKYQIATKQVPGHFLGNLIQLGSRVAPYLSPYAMGIRQAAQPVMQRGAELAGRIAQSPAARLARRAGKAIEKSPLGQAAGKTFSVLSLPLAGISGGKTVYDTTMAASDFMDGNVEGAKARGLEALRSGLDTAAAIPFLRPGAYLTSKAFTGTGKTGITKLAGEITPKFVKKNPLVSEIPIAAGYMMLPENAEGQEMFDPSKPKTASELGLSPPTPEDEEQIIDDSTKDATEQNLESTPPDQKQLLVNSENLARVYGQAEGELADERKDVTSMESVLKETEPEMYEKIMSGEEGADVTEAQVILDTNFASANETGLIKNNVNPDGDNSLAGNANYSENETSLMEIASAQEIEAGNMLKSQKLINEYEKKLDDRQKQSFDEYKKTYQQMTGDDGTNNYRDIAIFKWAMRMMSAKTAQSGMAGFFDVLGRSSSALADDILAIDQNEKAQNRYMAERYLDYEKAFDATTAQNDKEVFAAQLGLAQQLEERAYQTNRDEAKRAHEMAKLQAELRQKAAAAKAKALKENMKVDNPQTFLVEDPNAFGGRRSITVYQNPQKVPMKYGPIYNEKGQIVSRQLQPFTDANGLPADLDQYRKVEYNDTLIAKTFNSMKMANEAMRFSKQFGDITDQFGDDVIGLSGAFKILQANLTDVLSQVPVAGDSLSSMLGGNNLNAYVTSGSDEEFKRELSKLAGETDSGALVDQKEVQAILDQYDRDISKVKNRLSAVRYNYGIKRGDKSQVEALSSLMIMEQRMKYVLAHANKAGDRLALSDIASAAQRTEIFPLFKSRDIIKENYKKFSTEMETVMKQKFEEYLQYGGDPNVIMRAFPDNEWVIKTLDKQGLKQQNIPSEADIIENLKRKGLITS